MHVLVRIRVHTNSKQDRRLNTLLIMGAETIPNSQVFRAWTLKKPTELSICLSPTHLIAYICCSANYALHLRLRSPAADCISHSLPRGRAWPPNQYASTLFVLASTPPHPPACVPSPIHPPDHRTAGPASWLSGSHTLSNRPLHLLPSGQPRLPRSRNRPLIHSHGDLLTPPRAYTGRDRRI